VKRLEEPEPAAAPPERAAPLREPREPAAPRPELEFFNGLGGFAADGREYLTILGEGQWTPAPWINVIANPSFGFQVSSGGGLPGRPIGRTRSPLGRDPVATPRQTIYLRGNTGHLWGRPSSIREEAWPITAARGDHPLPHRSQHQLEPPVRPSRIP
jgi:cyclic beta-1,2-glucan synthetase